MLTPPPPPPPPCRMFGISQRTQRWSRDRVWRRPGERSAACNVLQHDRFGSGVEWNFFGGGGGREGCTALHLLARGGLTAIRYPDEILTRLVRPYCWCSTSGTSCLAPSTNAADWPGAGGCFSPGMGGDPSGDHPPPHQERGQALQGGHPGTHTHTCRSAGQAVKHLTGSRTFRRP